MSKGDFFLAVVGFALILVLVAFAVTGMAAKRQELRTLVKEKYHKTVN